LKSFSLNRSGEVIQKQDLPLPQQVTFDPNPGKLQDMINSAINHAVQTFKEGQAPPLYAGPAYHQPKLSSVVAPSAPLVVAGTKVTSPPSMVGLANEQSTLMRSDRMTLGGRV